jgi:GTP-binding protein Era
MSLKAGYVAIIGKPNAGKSTLMNAILGTKLSIVTPKPQTTRKQVLGIFTEGDTQMVFLDTPGLLKPRYELHRSMMSYVGESLLAADAVLLLIDLEKYKNFDNYFATETINTLNNLTKPIIVVLNKIDTITDRREVLPIMEELAKNPLFKEIIPLSALKVDNVKELLGILQKYIPEGEFFFDADQLSSQTERFFVTEIIREVIFMSFGDEIPYSTELSVSEFKEREKGKWYISVDIIVEKDSQKRIMIGTKGEKIKSVGEKSRLAIEEHLEQSVYLELFVKVRDNWRSNPTLLKSYGYK